MMRCLLVLALCVLAVCASNAAELDNRQSCVVDSLFTHILHLERTVASLSAELKSMATNQELMKSTVLANISLSLAAQEAAHQAVQQAAQLAAQQAAQLAAQQAAQATAVAYSVSLQSDIIQTAEKPLTFDTVDYNQGNAYNKATGMFTAPVSGTYVFWANVMIRSNSFMAIRIFKGSTEIGRGYITAQRHGVASIITTTYLVQGDQVRMDAEIPSSTIPLRGSKYSSYGGTLIRA